MAKINVPGGDDSKPKILAQWGGLNTHADRAAIPENDFSWLENWFPIAPGNLRTLYAEGSTLYTAGQTIISIYPYNLGATAYLAVFLTDGSAIQVQVSNGATTTIGAAGTFYSGGTIPACSQYQSLYLIIGSDVAANAYWVWDGAHLFGAGTLSPQVTVVAGGRNYTTTPTISAVGGSGSGANFSASVANGSVVSAKCTNGGSGYKLGEKVVLTISGGGSDTEAQATAIITNPGIAAVGAVFVTNGGSGYTAAPTVTIASPGSGVTQATATANIVGGQITSYTMTNVGSNYSFNPRVVVTGGGGSGATATTSVDSLGRVTVTPVTVGSGYGAGTTVTIDAPVDFVQATAFAQITNGSVSAIIVTNPGYLYNAGVGAPVVTISAPVSGTTATATAQLVQGLVAVADVISGGAGYGSTPNVTFSPPDDPTSLLPATATGVATLGTGGTQGQVTSIIIGLHGAGYINAAVDLQGGNNCAHLTATLMPFGVQATAIETFNNQIWTTANPASGAKMSFTAPNSVSDFSTFDGGGTAPATDSFLRNTLTALKANEGFLYRLADSSCSVIGNVTTSSGAITTYNLSPVDTQIGTIWRDTVCAFDRAIVFANSTGVYALFAGAIQKVSDQLDQIFLTASFNTGAGGVTPTAAVCTIFGIRCYCLLITAKDHLGVSRNYLCCWNGKAWFVASQTKTMTLVALQELNSIFTAWGTDGTRVFKLFQTASTSLTKIYQTRLDGAAMPDTEVRADHAYFVANLLSGSSSSISMVFDSETGSNPAQTYNLVAGRQIVQANIDPNGASYGRLRGFTGSTTAADLQLISLESLESSYTRKV